jgi:hypothetical protein
MKNVPKIERNFSEASLTHRKTEDEKHSKSPVKADTKIYAKADDIMTRNQSIELIKNANDDENFGASSKNKPR